MARNRRLILSPPPGVRDLLSDGHRYGEWVSGTRQVLAVDPHWPDVGARLRVRVGVGPLTLDDACVVRIVVNLTPWGENTPFVLDRHPLRGPGIRMHGLPVDHIVSTATA